MDTKHILVINPSRIADHNSGVLPKKIEKATADIIQRIKADKKMMAGCEGLFPLHSSEYNLRKSILYQSPPKRNEESTQATRGVY